MQPIQRLCRYLLPEWLLDRQPDPTHAHRRRFTRCYRRKRRIVKSLWIVSGLAMLLQGAAPVFVLPIALGTTFAAFCILDETS